MNPEQALGLRRQLVAVRQRLCESRLALLRSQAERRDALAQSFAPAQGLATGQSLQARDHFRAELAQASASHDAAVAEASAAAAECAVDLRRAEHAVETVAAGARRTALARARRRQLPRAKPVL